MAHTVSQPTRANTPQADLRWLVVTLDLVDRHPAVYTAVDAAEQLIDADAVAFLDALARDAVTPSRLAAAADVAAAVLTPCAVRRRRARRQGTPESEYAASGTRGARWGIEARRQGAREVRRRGAAGGGSEGGGSPAGQSPWSTLDAAAPAGALDLGLCAVDAGGKDGVGESVAGGTPAASLGSGSMDHLPQCAVDQLMAALQEFWTERRVNG
jgi:hypothetical protein